MKVQKNNHLQEEQILWAVIDEKELGVDVRDHLLECSLCQAKVTRFKDDLQEFGQQARQAVPPSSRQFKLPVAKPGVFSHIPGWLPVTAAAAITGFIVFFYFMGLQTMTPPSEVTTLQNRENIVEDETLMREISELVDRPLSNNMYEISGDDEEEGNTYDDDFLQFAVPDTQDDFQSELILQGGIKRC